METGLWLRFAYLSFQDIVEEYRIWTRQQICEHVFGAHDIPDEIMNRAAGNYTEAQETKKDEVIEVHNSHRALMQSADDIDQLEDMYASAMAAVTDEINS